MIAGVSWQDGIVALAATFAGAWLIRRWIQKRRASQGCDQCAAALLQARARTSGGKAETTTR